MKARVIRSLSFAPRILIAVLAVIAASTLVYADSGPFSVSRCITGTTDLEHPYDDPSNYYAITADTYVYCGGTLNIAWDGVNEEAPQVRLSDGVNIHVGYCDSGACDCACDDDDDSDVGTLTIDGNSGTEQKIVHITSSSDSSSNHWGSIRLGPDSTGNDIEEAHILYGGGGAYTAAVVNAGPLTMSITEIEESDTNGLNCNAGCDMTWTSFNIHDNDGHGVQVSNAGDLELIKAGQGHIEDNGKSGIYQYGDYTAVTLTGQGGSATQLAKINGNARHGVNVCNGVLDMNYAGVNNNGDDGGPYYEGVIVKNNGASRAYISNSQITGSAKAGLRQGDGIVQIEDSDITGNSVVQTAYSNGGNDYHTGILIIDALDDNSSVADSCVHANHPSGAEDWEHLEIANFMGNDEFNTGDWHAPGNWWDVYTSLNYVIHDDNNHPLDLNSWATIWLDDDDDDDDDDTCPLNIGN